ncbi:MAG: DUF3656 domain-containing protein, partial [Spirochaetales bacterium]|nr:DUF3656 domain-containing protein [Spirochaetales bacterium]
GDRIRIQPKSGDEGPQMTITSMNRAREKVNRAQKGDIIFIAFNQQVQSGSLVYKVGDTPGKSAVNIKTLSVYINPTIVDLAINIDRAGFKIDLPEYPEPGSWIKKVEIEPASKHSLTEEVIQKSFISTKEKMIKTGEIDVEITGDLFLPASTLKKIRREFWEERVDKILSMTEVSKTNNGIFEFMRIHSSSMGYNEETSPCRNVYITDPLKKTTGKSRTRSSKLADAIHVMPLSAYNKDCEEIILPYFSNEFSLEKIKSDIDTAWKAGIRRFRISSLFHLSLLKEYKDLIITAAYPLPVSNSFASRQLMEHQVNKIQSWVELEKEALINLVYFSPLPVEVYRYGRPHIFTTRANINVEGEIADSHGVKFIVKKDAEAGLNSIYGHKVIKIPNIENTSGCFDYRNAEPGETATTDFNFS